MIDVRYQRGIFLPKQNLWLDPWDAKPLAFVSHEHSDHIAPHAEIIVVPYDPHDVRTITMDEKSLEEAWLIAGSTVLTM